MARQPRTPAPAAAPAFNEDALANAGAKLTARAQALVPIDEKFGGGLVYHRDRVVDEAAFFINQGSESFFEAGKRLLLLKEHEEFGAFTSALDRIGIDVRAAQRLMTVAARFADSKALGVLPRTKLLELAVLDDESIAELDKGGTAAGLTFDDVDRMGVRELRLALRKERDLHAEDNDSNERLVASKDKKLNAMARKTTEPWDERMGGLVDELHTCSLGASEMLTKVFQVAEASAAFKIDHDEQMHQKTELAVRLINDVNLLVQRVAAIQAFAYEHFMPFVDTGASPVLTEPLHPSSKKR